METNLFGEPDNPRNPAPAKHKMAKKKPVVEKTRGAFDWKSWEQFGYPTLEPHSQAKLDVLRDYLIDYIVICCSALPPGVPRFPIYIVDGFCGGGIYEGEKVGSPLIILKAIREAEFKVNLGRSNPIKIDAKYFFVDDCKSALASLRNQLGKSEFSSQIDESIILRENAFEDEFPSICRKLSSDHKRGGARVLFFLDQCGYKKVPPSMIQQISRKLPKAEFIVNFAITWLSDFLGDNEAASKLLDATGLAKEIELSELTRVRVTEGKSSWAWTVESKLSSAYQKLCGMPFFSPFYISPQDNHRGYWLLHLAPHPKARQAMVSVLWDQANRVRHFGKSGLEILAFKPDEDDEVYLNGTTFGDFEKPHLLYRIKEELSPYVRKNFPDGVTFKDLLASVCNHTNADRKIVSSALCELKTDNELVIKGKGGGDKKGTLFDLTDHDIISSPNQFWLKL